VSLPEISSGIPKNILSIFSSHDAGPGDGELPYYSITDS
jgi:hypothetical protein